MFAWLQSNWPTVVAPLVVAIIDLFYALSPNLKANGILHQLFLLCGGKDPVPPASS